MTNSTTISDHAQDDADEPRLRVFLSHSGTDSPWAQQFVEDARQSGIFVYTYENDPQPGHSIAAKLQAEIAACDLVVVYFSRKGANSAYIHQEIGWALHEGKIIIPLVEKGTRHDKFAMLSNDIERITIDPAEPQNANALLLSALTRQIDQRIAKLEMMETKTEEERQRKEALLAELKQLGIVAGLALLLILAVIGLSYWMSSSAT